MRNLFNSFLTGRINQIIPVSVIFLAVIVGSIVFFIRYRVYIHRKKKFDMMSNLNNEGHVSNEAVTQSEATVEETSGNALSEAVTQPEASVEETSGNVSSEAVTQSEAPVVEAVESNERDSKEQRDQNPGADSQSTEIETDNTEDKISEDEK